MKLEHGHPMTLIDNGGELVCSYCHQHLDEFYRCKCRNPRCRDSSRDRRCELCDERVSGSCYACKLCWEFVHQSCFELPEEIQINYRPGCLLYFQEESEKWKQLDCDFCKQKHGRYKYCCGDCSFQIGVGCASKLIKYHNQGQKHVERFSHRHPLTLLKLDDTMNCMFCYKSIDYPEAYGCAPCQFFIHNSCREHEFLPKIRHAFHPQHPLTLKDLDYSRCGACRLDIQGFGYECHQCDFRLHPQCTALKPNIKYKGHEQHLLILVENLSYDKRQCDECSFYIKDVFFMRCVECNFNFHLQCGSDHALPPNFWNKEHKHPLVLIIEKHAAEEDHIHQLPLYCNACGKERKAEDPFYRCAEPECEYAAHVRCIITEVQYDDKVKLRHFSHYHILIFRDIHEKGKIRCYGCQKEVEGPAYGCDPCQHYLHKSCAKLPTKIYDHPSHEHDLDLLTNYSSGKCNSCRKDKSGFVYCCRFCDFRLDLDCASLHPSVNLIVSTDESTGHEGQERIGHFSHKHHLIILDVAAGVNCKLCVKSIIGQCYGCAQCDFYIHRSCVALQQGIRSPFHPRKSLGLLEFQERTYRCDACLFNIEGFAYFTGSGFSPVFHPECVSLKPNIEYKGHEHLLTLVENMSFQWQCEACGLKNVSTFFMRCVACNLNFHVQCGPNPLPAAILHKENGHLLTLKTQTLDVQDCIFCSKKINPEHPAYYCAEFEYYAHVRCAITEVQVDEREVLVGDRAAQIDESGKMKHFSHRHFLFPLENNKGNNNFICCACEKDIKDTPAYGCDLCKFYLHKFCAELPREIQHPFHRYSLFLPMPYSEEYHVCNACQKHYKGFSYQSQESKFNLDLDCSKLLPSIKLESVHKHTLSFFEKLYRTLECDYCKSIPSNKVTPLDAYYVRCVVCDFSRHFLCCPLPRTMEHDTHEHSLTLKDNFLDLFDGSDDDEYCCDVCETRQDARECVYHCEECNFVVDVTECLFSEVMQFLEGKHEGVQGRIISRKITRKIKGLSYKHVIESLTEEEKMIMEQFTNEEVNKIRKGTDLLDIFKELREVNQLANLKMSAELSNIGNDFLKSMPKKVEQLKSIDEELVDVGDYKICRKLAPVLKSLLDKYEDIGASCSLTQRLKTILLTTLCVIMQEMKDTKVIDIKTGSIILWWFHLKIIQRAGFRVDFALDHVKRVVHVRFLVDDESPIKSSPFYGIHKEIAERSKMIDGQTKRIEELEKKAQAAVSGHGSERLISEAANLNDTLKFSWKTAATGLLDDIPEF